MPASVRRHRVPLALLAAIGWLAASCGDAAEPVRDRSPAPAPVAPASEPAPPELRNLLIVTLDTTRADALGIHGQARPTSPAIDRLASTGVMFRNVVTSSPLTLPSHSTLFTGKQPYAHGVRSNTGYVLSRENLTLAEVLGERGYATAAEVAVDVLSRDKQLDQGFARYRGPRDPGVVLKQVGVRGTGRTIEKPIRTGADITRRGVQFLRSQRDRPFFLWLHYFDAHQPLTPSQSATSKIPDSRYHAAVADQDRAVGEVLAELERLGLSERTLVVITADHGEALGDHDESTHGYFVYDSTMRVPLVLGGLPELEPGRVIDSLVRTVDIAPTALDLLGAPPLVDAQGVSLAPLATGEVASLPLVGYGESVELSSAFGLPPLRFVREGRWKYIHKLRPQLFDVESDPAESENLLERHPEIAARLRGRLETLLRAAPAPPADAAGSIDAESAAQLAALGYVGATAAPERFDEVASLALSGDDPEDKAEDVKRLSEAMAFAANGRHDEALGRLAPLLERNPESAVVLRLQADALTGLGRDAEAIDQYMAAEAVAPCDDLALSALNRLLRRALRWDELVSLLGRATETCRDVPTAFNNYAWALATLPRNDLRDGAEAVVTARAALTMRGDRDPAYLDTLGAALAEAGRFDEAVAVQREALRGFRDARAPAPVMAEVERHLEAYLAGRPIRDPAS